MLDFYILRNNECSFRGCWQAIFDQKQVIGATWQRELIQTLVSMNKKFSAIDMSLLSGLEKRQEQKIDKFIGTILVLAGIAPLLGLLGTVCGMINTFEVIAWFGTGNAKAMASGISEALITTQAGLVVAVPGLVLGNFLQHRAESLKSRIHRFCLGLVRETSAYTGEKGYKEN